MHPTIKACLLLAALALTGAAGPAGCQTTGLGPAEVKPICDALIGPIRYNTYKTTSTRFAGKALAPDLKQRNQVGEHLGCTGY